MSEYTPELLPCPFCGGDASLEDTRIGFGVVCWDCQIKTTMDWTKEKAISIWNTRAESSRRTHHRYAKIKQIEKAATYVCKLLGENEQH